MSSSILQQKQHAAGTRAGAPGEQLGDLKSAALEAAASAIAITDREGIVVWVNHSFHQLTGYSSEEVIGHSMRLLKSGHHPPSFYASMWETILSGQKWQGNIVNRRKDGTLYDGNMTIAPVRDGGGEITHFIAVSHDISGQSRAEERASMLAQAIQNSLDLIGVSDHAGELIFVNEALLKVTGHKTEEIIGKHFGELFSPDNPASVVEDIGTKGLESGGWKGDCLIRRRDGTDFTAFLNVGPIKDKQGGVIGMVGIARDITERKKTEDALRQSEAKFKALFETANDAIMIMSGGTFSDCNLRAETFFQCGRDAILGRSPLDFSPSKQPDGRLSSEKTAEIMQAALNGQPQRFEWQHVRADGTLFDAEVSVNRVVALGAGYLQAIVRDITERKQAENALRQARAKLSAALGASEQQARGAAKLTELVDILQSCQTAEEAYKITESVLQSALTVPSGALCVTSSSRDVVEIVAKWGGVLSTERAFRPDDCWALRRGKLHRVNDPASPLRCAHVAGSLAGGHLCVPLVAQGETLGVLYLELPFSPAGHPADPNENQMETVEAQAISVGERLSLALANLRLREVLRAQSVRDPLTGLFNRRFMEESLERELRRAVRGKNHLALLMLDIDHFKDFNDTFGHLAGDALLRALGNLLKERTRGQDVACRYGGEEFAFILAGASLDAARKRAEMLREDIRKLDVQHGRQLLGVVTVSIGIAVYPDHAETVEALLKAADGALYRAKAEGRDRIAVA